ncbi:hypothetical protein GCM10023340_45260 [Nocardioides marinquilinus]|uniref:N-acetyltransferase domain-containing protein n=1 Tax=Nocardioides marinquilinus TaxID=1210400 RepID=A0ABP9Q515_9ACTN
MTIEVGAGDRPGVWPVYDAVFGDQPDEATWREAVWDRHVARDGFRLAVAVADGSDGSDGSDGGSLDGFGYGYTGEHGQWWTDQVARTLPRDVATAWLGGHFELVSIGVLPRARRRGLGRALMRALVDGVPHERLLLMTTDDAGDPARRLYAAEGWTVLGPGVGEHTVVMGRAAAR